MNIWLAVIAGMSGYLVGSISIARLIAARVLPDSELSSTSITWGEDDTGFVSDNISATTLRQEAGTKWGCLTGIFDILKSTIGVAIFHFVFPDQPYDVVYGIAVTAGHNLPVWYGFQGGRGTSTILGALLILDPMSIPVTILIGQAIGILLLKDVLLAHHAGWIVLLPVWFAAFQRWDLVVFALGINFFRWIVSGDELKTYFQLRKSGALRTREFHETIEQTHIGYMHKYARKYGLVKYDYMRDD